MINKQLGGALFWSLFILVINIETATGRVLRCYKVEEWKTVEITLHSQYKYQNPFNEVVLDAIFDGPKGVKIVRPAFWDGGNTWKIRFAPPQKGNWEMTTVSNKSNDTGLHSVKCKVKCKRYKGNLDIYKHGFVKVSDNGRYFVYNDGTPFFYLGDTHWCFIHERYNTSNIDGIESQFRYIVDKRIKQGFTVYQSEAIQMVHEKEPLIKDEEPHCTFDNGFGEDDLPGLRNMDRKFAYIANRGLLHANSQICWVTEPRQHKDVYSIDYMYNLGRYWSARYGAYPVLWTVAQEVDRNLYGSLTDKDLELWICMAKGLTENDSYKHPLTAHMENDGNMTANNSSWGDFDFHQWWAIQWKGAKNVPNRIKTFWYNSKNKPAILYESGYEHLEVDALISLRQGFLAFQSGLYGYGYGANGIWNDLYDNNDWGTRYKMPQKYIHWFNGVNLEGADLLSNLKTFYQSINWWELEPRFDNKDWVDFSNTDNYAVSSIDNTLYVVYLWTDLKTSAGKLKKLKVDEPYIAKWYNPSEGLYYDIGEFISNDGEYTIPPIPKSGDWILVLKEKQ